jgi:hypothetical protein
VWVRGAHTGLYKVAVDRIISLGLLEVREILISPARHDCYCVDIHCAWPVGELWEVCLVLGDGGGFRDGPWRGSSLGVLGWLAGWSMLVGLSRLHGAALHI